MAEIGASRRVWPEAKHQREALRRRLRGNLPTTSYNAERAAKEHKFIDIAFKPHGRTDPDDSEGGVPGEICERTIPATMTNTMRHIDENTNAFKIRIPAPNRMNAVQATQSEGNDSPELAGGHPHSPGATAHPAKTTKHTIRIPASSTRRALSPPVVTDTPDPCEEVERHTFCPVEHRDTIIKMMERHFCAHPLIPGFYTPTRH